MEELISILTNEIKRLNEEIKHYSNKLDDRVNPIINILNNNLDQISILKNIVLDDLRDILPSSFNEELKTLDFYIKVLGLSYATELEKNANIIEDVRKIIMKINSYLTNLVKENEDNQKIVSSCEAEREKYLSLEKKIISPSLIEPEDILSVYELLNNMDDKEKAIRVLISFGEIYLSSLEKTDTPNEVIPLSQEDSVEEEIFKENKDLDKINRELKQLFDNFKLDYESFIKRLNEQKITEFFGLVNVDNVKDILYSFAEYDIDLNDKYNDEKVLLSKANQLTKVFVYSNKDLIKVLLDLMKSKQIINKKIINVEGKSKEGIDIDLLLEAPARFIKRKKRRKISGDLTIDIEMPGGAYLGAYDDFISNIQLFENYGIEAKDVCKNVSTSVLPNDRIKKTIALFNFYGLDEKQFKTLSCFNSIHQAEMLDIFIELGLFNIISNNMSRCCLAPDDIIIYRIIYGIKHTNIPFNEMFTKNRFTYLISGNKVKNSTKTFDINNRNKENKVGQRKAEFNEVYLKYDQLIDPFNIDTTIVNTRSDSVIPILDANFLLTDNEGKMVIPSVYNFGNVETLRGSVPLIISRNKVLRLCNEFMAHDIDVNNIDNIMYIITKNCILTDDEYDIIYNKISEVLNRGVIK